MLLYFFIHEFNDVLSAISTLRSKKGSSLSEIVPHYRHLVYVDDIPSKIY